MILKTNLHVMNFSNIAELLRNNTNEPCRKPKNHHVYMDKNSNLQKAILRELPKSISKREHQYILKLGKKVDLMII